MSFSKWTTTRHSTNLNEVGGEASVQLKRREGLMPDRRCSTALGRLSPKVLEAFAFGSSFHKYIDFTMPLFVSGVT